MTRCAWWQCAGPSGSCDEAVARLSPPPHVLSHLPSTWHLAPACRPPRAGALVVDYGVDHASGDSLRGIKKHQFVHPLQEPGVCDLVSGSTRERCRPARAAGRTPASRGTVTNEAASSRSLPTLTFRRCGARPRPLRRRCARGDPRLRAPSCTPWASARACRSCSRPPTVRRAHRACASAASWLDWGPSAHLCRQRGEAARPPAGLPAPDGGQRNGVALQGAGRGVAARRRVPGLRVLAGELGQQPSVTQRHS